MNFSVGQKVVCVDAECRHPKGSLFVGLHGKQAKSNGIMCGLSRGTVYTIREITFSGRGVLLNEIIRPGNDCGFCSSRFRPVVERRTDISIFTRMLTSAPRVKEKSP